MPLKRPVPKTQYTLWWVLFRFDGRLNRKEFWLAYVALLMFMMAYFLLRYGDLMIVTVQGELKFLPEAMVEFWIIALTNFYISLAIAVKRLHDIGWSGFFAFLYVFFGIFGMTILGALPGEKGRNDYGPEPPRK